MTDGALERLRRLSVIVFWISYVWVMFWPYYQLYWRITYGTM